MTGKSKRKLAIGIAGLLLGAVTAAPAQAQAPYLTTESTVAELHANEGIVGSGFDSWDRGSLFPEQPWEYPNWTLRQYTGDTAEDAVAGLNLIIDNYNQGIQVTYPLYTEEEIAEDPTRADAEIYYFPAAEAGGKYALLLSGNMMERSAKVDECCSAVSQLHEMGYAAFILRYRIGHELKENANYKDLVRAVQFITQNADALGVQAEDYALVGFSSGGHLCGMFGTDRMGYSNYGLPKPGALLLAYPILDYVYGKPLLFYGYDGAKPGDDLAPGDYFYNIEVPDEVTADFPATFHWFGRDDSTLRGLIPSVQSQKLDKALEECGVLHKMVIYDHAPHGSGNGAGTDAAGWLYEAAAFWEEAVGSEERV